MIKKTNTEVVVNPKTLQEEYVFMKIVSVDYNLINNAYSVKIKYYYEKDVLTGMFDGANNPIIHKKKVILNYSTVKFSRAEADAIEAFSGGLTGNSHTDKLLHLISIGSAYQLSVAPVYGLSTTGWIDPTVPIPDPNSPPPTEPE